MATGNLPHADNDEATHFSLAVEWVETTDFPKWSHVFARMRSETRAEVKWANTCSS